MQNEQANPQETGRGSRKNGRTVLVLAGIVAGMFAFGFALVPLYQIFCDVTGFNGGSQVRVTDESYSGKIDEERLVTVQFDSTINAGLPWDFKPLTRSMQVHPGQVYEVAYVAKNNAEHAIVAQAVPGVTPWQATQHFNKMECFCFSNQTLASGESREMPLRFVLSPTLPEEINTLTLSYTFMNTDRGNSLKSGESFQIFPATRSDMDPTPLTMNTSPGGSTR